MKIKSIVLSVLMVACAFALAPKPTEAAKCGSKTVTKVNTVVGNSFFGSQSSFMGSNSGGNAIIGSIGTNTLATGTNTNTSTQTITGVNTNTVTVGVVSGGTTSTTNVVNTGSFVSICN